MAQQENTPGGMHVVDADLAAEALQSVDTVRERARLTAGLTPAWYGPRRPWP